MIKNNLKAILQRKQTSQRQLARSIGTRPNTISSIASNRQTSYDMRLIDKILAHLNLKIEEFFYRTGDKASGD